jgi:ABC-type multidrug transport system fused ATPase/permease subunit
MRIVVGSLRVFLGLLLVWLCKQFIDITIRQGTTRDIIMMICLLVMTVIGGIMLRQIYYYMTTAATIRQSNTIRRRLFSMLFSKQLYNNMVLHSGDITSRMAKDIEVISNTTTSSIPDMLITGFQLAGAFLLMHSMDKKLAWILLLLTPLTIIIGKLISKQLRKMTLDIRKDESRIQIQIQESMELNAILRALNSEEWVTERLDTTQQQLKGNTMKRARFTVYMRIAFGLTFGLGYLLAFIWGGIQLRNGIITFGVMTSFLQLVGQVQQPILTLLNNIATLIHTTASIDRLKELESDTTVQSSALYQNRQISLTPVGVKVNDLCFRYASGDKMVINHFSHIFLPGSKTAIMGATGIGKTTLFRLMLALVKPDGGSISIYNNKVEESVSEDTRQHFVFVPQGNTLISGTIRDNLLLADPDATDELLWEVLHTAVADFIEELPEGLDTELGEHGNGLSEGQAQRIAIARGLLRPGHILLLDEISASLDEQTEQELYRRLFAKFPHKTMIFITHRPSVSDMCDETIRMK